MDKRKGMGLIDYLREQKSLPIIIALLLAGVLLLLLPSGVSNKSNKTDDGERLSKYGQELERKIGELCSQIRGAGSVSVNVYFESGFETVYAYNEESKTGSGGVNSEKKYVTVGSGNDESMVCIVEKMPSICGVAVVCSGGSDPIVAERIINLISSAYGVPKNKIYVAERKK